MGTSAVVEYVKQMLNTIKTPAMMLPAILLKCTAIQRPGLSPQEIASVIIERNKAIGIPTGENPDGSNNLVNMYTYNVVKSMVDALKQDGVVHVAIPAKSLVIEATGGNAGGPVTVVGTNLTDTTAYGIIV